MLFCRERRDRGCWKQEQQRLSLSHGPGAGKRAQQNRRAMVQHEAQVFLGCRRELELLTEDVKLDNYGRNRGILGGTPQIPPTAVPPN